MRLNLKNESEIMRRLSHFLGSGQGIIESLDLLSLSYPMMKEVAVSVKGGKPLYSALKTKVGFSSISMKMIEVGEMTGTLSDSLAKLSTHLRHTHELRSKIISSCTYPLIVSILSLSMITFMLLYIVPQILPIFASLNVDLPWSTRLLININYFVSGHKLIIAMLTGLFVIAMFLILYFRKLRQYFVSSIYSIYGIRSIIRMIFLISFCRSMGIMLHSNVGVLQALAILGDSESNLKHKRILKDFDSHIRQGKSFSSFMFLQTETFGQTAPRFIEVGERTGGLSRSFIYFADYIEHDFVTLLNRLTHLLEPALMIALGFVVGFISLSLITPLYELSGISHV